MLQTLQRDIDVNLNDVNVSYNCLLDKFGELYKVCFPIITKRFKICQNKQRPWISSAIVTSIKRKNKLYRLWLCKKFDIALIKYKKYINKLTHIIRAAEKCIFRTNFLKSRVISKQLGD